MTPGVSVQTGAGPVPLLQEWRFWRWMPGGFLCEWRSRETDPAWGVLEGGYVAASWWGLKFLQRFHKTGVAAVGRQKELILRFELSLRKVVTTGFLHLELFNPAEARLWILNFKVWPGWNLFFLMNLGYRLTSASQSARAQKMRQIMLEQAKREQAERLQAQRFARKIAKQRAGHPWPSVKH